MTKTIINEAALLVTMDQERRELKDGAMVIKDQAIAWVGESAALPAEHAVGIDQTISMQGNWSCPV